MAAKETKQQSLVPVHIGLIMDGNRRWAAEQGISSLKGHRRGADALKDLTLEAFELGVKYVSAFVFSILPRIA
jgi:undecaprenyl diphosphate synthase